MRADEQMLIELWSRDRIEMPTCEIAKRLRCGESKVHEMRQSLGLPPRRRLSPLRGRIKVDVSESEFRRLWGMSPLKMPTKAIAQHFRISPGTVSLLKSRFRLPDRERVGRPRGNDVIVVDIPSLFRLWHRPAEIMPVAEICRRLGGISQSHLYKLAKAHKLPKREKADPVHPDDPTPEQIAERAAEVRRSWPEGEAEKRMSGARRNRWTMPSYSYNGRYAAFEETAVDI